MGEGMNANKHELAIELKSATCTALSVKQDDSGNWIARETLWKSHALREEKSRKRVVVCLWPGLSRRWSEHEPAPSLETMAWK
jgi:hypothetical protein